MKNEFHLPNRATELFARSLFGLLKVGLPVPDHTTLSRGGKTLKVALPRRAYGHLDLVMNSTGLKIYGEGEWKVLTHGKSKRRIWRKPVDELFDLERYRRMSGRVQELGSSPASRQTYRVAADQLSYLTKTPISHTAVGRMVWEVGNRIADGEEAESRRMFEQGEEHAGGRIPAAVLYGESDGVWVHLQREAKRSLEVRVAILSTGRKPVRKDRYRPENKQSVTAMGLSGEQWQEAILREAHMTYDLSQTKMLIWGGDGNAWVRHSFDRMDLPQQFVLDRFHLQRATRRAYPDRGEARQVVSRLRQEGFPAVAPKLSQDIRQARNERRQRLLDFYQYVSDNQDGLLDLEYRRCPFPAYLGAMEGNVDKLVVHRMKGRGCSWRLPGVRAMLALCRHADQLRSQAYRYLPLQTPPRTYRTEQALEVHNTLRPPRQPSLPFRDPIRTIPGSGSFIG